MPGDGNPESTIDGEDVETEGSTLMVGEDDTAREITTKKKGKKKLTKKGKRKAQKERI